MAGESQAPQDIEVVPDSTETTPVASTSDSKLPDHRHRAANPLVKRLDDAELQKSLNGAISTKARALKSNASPSPTSATAGPSHPRVNFGSSAPIKTGPPKGKLPNRKSSLLVFDKNGGGLRTLKRGSKSAQNAGEDSVHQPESGSNAATVDTLDSPNDDFGVPGPCSQSQPAPSGEELLALAGHNQGDASDLPDFDDEPASADAAKPAL